MNNEASAGEVARMLRESARDFAQREQDHRGLRERMGTLPGYSPAVFHRMQELGWRSALLGEELGGSGMGLREAAAIAEELGKALLGEPFVATAVLPVRLLQDPHALPPAMPLLQAVAEGETTLALAWQEQAGSIDPSAIAMQAQPAASGFVLSGRKRWVAGGAAATGLLVSARTADGVAVFHVPRNAPGLALAHGRQVDGTPGICVDLADVRVPRDAMVVDGGHGAKAVARSVDAAAVVASAELLGVTRRALEMTLAYMRTRTQFDKPIGSFQALQHKAVDLLVQQELAAAVLEEAVGALDHRPAGRETSCLASRCKARCGDAAVRVTRECIQLHGAIGYTHEYDIGLYLKRALVLAAWLGNAAQHRRRHFALVAGDEVPASCGT